MTPDDFRRLALALPRAEPNAHMGHPDFRVGGKIFASLDGGGTQGGLKLSPEQQEMLMDAVPGQFSPAAGAWGRRGWTMMRLDGIDEPTVTSALTMAWRNTAPPKLLRELGV